MSYFCRFPSLSASSLFCTAALIGSFSLSAQVSLTALGVAQTQSFDTLATAGTTNPWTDNSVIVGWYATQTAGTLINYRAGDGSSNTGAIYSFGTGTNVERALGSAASGTPANLIYAARYVNNTGATITSLLVSYTGEQWRNGGNVTAQKLDFSFQVANAGVITAANTPATGWTDVNTLDFNGPIATATAAALNGNLVANQATPTDTIALSVAPGQEVWIRWFDTNDAGNDHGFGVDNVSVTPQGVAGSSADLSVIKTDSPDPVIAGSNITYTITATNTGPDPASTVSLSDTLPAGTTFVSLPAVAGWTCTAPTIGAGGTISCSIASLPVGSAVFTLTVAVDSATVPGTVLSNTASASSTTTDPNTGNESDTATTTVGAGSADLSVTKTDTSDPVAPGSNLTYTITANNAGPSSALGVSLADTLPASTTFVSLASPGGWSCTTPVVGAAGTVSCTAAALAPGSAVFTLVVAVEAGVTPGTVLSNTATVASTTTDPSPGNESATATTTVGVGSADLSITKSAAPEPVTAGANLTYTISAANVGPSNAASASISDPLPAGTTFVSMASPVSWSCTTPVVGAGGTVSCSLASMPIGSAVFTLVVNVGAAVTGGTVLTNTATVTSATTDANPGNESATANSTVSAPATIAGTKTTTGNLIPGGTVTYTIVLSNSGTSAQADNSGNEFIDVLPAGLTLISAAASSPTAVATIGSNTVTWNGSIAAAGSVTITINATIDANLASGTTITNQGTINFDADGNGSNEATAVTDDPATGAPGDGTGFTVLGIATAIPMLSGWMQILLLGSLMLLAAVTLRRRVF